MHMCGPEKSLAFCTLVLARDQYPNKDTACQRTRRRKQIDGMVLFARDYFYGWNFFAVKMHNASFRCLNRLRTLYNAQVLIRFKNYSNQLRAILIRFD